MALNIGANLRYSGGLVDLKVGHISREIFVNDEIYRQEQEQVFARCWLFVGHESQVSKPGDFFVSCMGEESVILCRDRLGAIHVFLNSCMHRGMKVCRYDEGNTPVFTCPYHSWSYATDGKLVGVPTSRTPTTNNWTSLIGGWSKSPSLRIIKAASGPPGTRRPLRSPSIWAT